MNNPLEGHYFIAEKYENKHGEPAHRVLKTEATTIYGQVLDQVSPETFLVEMWGFKDDEFISICRTVIPLVRMLTFVFVVSSHEWKRLAEECRNLNSRPAS